MNAVLSVVGKDTVGILANVATKCSEYKANVVEVSQTVISDYFAMFMFINIDNLTIEFTKFVDELTNLGKTKGLEIHVMHEDIFNLMHKI
ncbi:MAG: ACT domain-containing protein [Bacilli bacterium]|nr:ACT domain-containing protein [Bacilli bacterium]